MKGIIFMAIALFSYVYAFKAVKQDHQLKLKIEEQEIIKNCGVCLRLYGAPWTPRFSASFHVREQLGDTMIIYKCQEIKDIDTCVIQKLYLNKAAQDTFYNQIIAIKSNFRLNNHDLDVHDGTKVSLIIGANSNNITLGYIGLGDAQSADPNIATLVNFINQKLPQDFQLF